MKVTIGKMHGMVDVVFLRGERVIGTTTFHGKTTSPYNRQVAVDGMPDQIIIDQVGAFDGITQYTRDDILQAFKKWCSYVANGGEVQDESSMTPEQHAEQNTQALINFIEGNYK